MSDKTTDPPSKDAEEAAKQEEEAAKEEAAKAKAAKAKAAKAKKPPPPPRPRLDELPRAEAAKERHRRLCEEGMTEVYIGHTPETLKGESHGKRYRVRLAQFGPELTYSGYHGETLEVPLEVARIAFHAGITAQPPPGYKEWSHGREIGAPTPMLAIHSDGAKVDPNKKNGPL